MYTPHVFWRLGRTLGITLLFLSVLGAQSSVSDSLLLRAEDEGLTTTERSLAWHQLGNYYDDEGDLPAAIAATRRALQLRLENETADPENVLVSAYNLGLYYFQLKEFPRAEAYFQMIIDRAPNRKLGVTYYQLGRLYGEIQEFTLADAAFRSARNLPPWSSVEDEGMSLRLLAAWSGAWLKKDDPANGQRVVSLLEEVVRNTKKGEPSYLRSLLLLNAGLGHTYAGNYAAAEPLYRRSLAENKACCDDPDRYAEIYTNLGLNARRRGRLAEAEEYYRQSLEIDLSLASGRTDAYVANDYNNLSSLFYFRGEYDSSLQYANQSLSWLLPDFLPVKSTDLPPEEQFGGVADQAQLLTCLYDAARARSQILDIPPETVLASYRYCDRVIDALRSDQRLEESKLSWRATAVDVYAEAINWCQQNKEAREALRYVEKSRAVLLLDERLERNTADVLPPDLRRRWLDLRSSSAYYEQQGGRDSTLIPLQRQLGVLEDSLRQLYPSAFRVLEEGGLDINRLQEGLGNKEVYVSYFLHDSVCLAVVVEPDDVRLVPLADLVEINRVANAFKATVRNGDLTFDPLPAHTLYQRLIEPLACPGGANLLLSLPPILADIPFAALLTEAVGTDAPYRDWPWLFREHTIVNVWSAALFLMERKGRSSPGGGILYWAPAAPGYGGIEKPELLLPMSAEPANLFPGGWRYDAFLGRAANSETFRDTIENYGVLHLSTHGYLGDQRGAPPYLLLSDTTYTALEVLRHSLSANLVVLNACQTGLGEQQQGEGIASLGRAFTRGGAEGIVFSLWPVDEKSSFELFQHFYRFLDDGRGKATGLGEARGAYLEQQTNNQLAHPYRWAGFVYYGEDEVMEAGKTLFSGFHWTLLGVALLLVAALWLRARSSRENGNN